MRKDLHSSHTSSGTLYLMPIRISTARLSSGPQLWGHLQHNTGTSFCSRGGISSNSEKQLHSSSVPGSILPAATSTTHLVLLPQYDLRDRDTQHYLAAAPLDRRRTFEMPSVFVQYSEVKVSVSYSFALGKLLIQSPLKSSCIRPDMKWLESWYHSKKKKQKKGKHECTLYYSLHLSHPNYHVYCDDSSFPYLKFK